MLLKYVFVGLKSPLLSGNSRLSLALVCISVFVALVCTPVFKFCCSLFTWKVLLYSVYLLMSVAFICILCFTVALFCVSAFQCGFRLLICVCYFSLCVSI